LSSIPLSQFLGWFFPSLGYLIVSLVILRGGYSRPAAYLGIIASVVDIVASFAFWFPGSAFELFISPGLWLLGLFAVSVGMMLFRLERKSISI
jgi:uncharacterized membrane protein